MLHQTRTNLGRKIRVCDQFLMDFPTQLWSSIQPFYVKYSFIESIKIDHLGNFDVAYPIRMMV